MDYHDMIEDEASPTSEEDVETDNRPAKSSLSPIILAGLIAGLVGAGAGAAAAYIALKSQSPDLTKLPNEIRAEFSEDMETLEARLSILETDVTALPDNSGLDIDLSAFEKRLSALENKPTAEISPEMMAALQTANADGFDWPDLSDIENRLASLENRRLATPEANTDAIDDLMTRLEALENHDTFLTVSEDLIVRIEALENRPAPDPEISIVSIPPLPVTAMLQGIEAEGEGGFFQRTLSKHVRVKDGDDPRNLIAQMEDQIETGRLDLALKTYERLPETVRTVGQTWYEAASRATKEAEK